MKQKIHLSLNSTLEEFVDEYVHSHLTTRTQLITDLIVKFKEEVSNDKRY